MICVESGLEHQSLWNNSLKRSSSETVKVMMVFFGYPSSKSDFLKGSTNPLKPNQPNQANQSVPGKLLKTKTESTESTESGESESFWEIIEKLTIISIINIVTGTSRIGILNFY